MNLYKIYIPNADLVIEYGAHCSKSIDTIVNDIKWIKENI